MYSLMVTM